MIDAVRFVRNENLPACLSDAEIRCSRNAASAKRQRSIACYGKSIDQTRLLIDQQLPGRLDVFAAITGAAAHGLTVQAKPKLMQ